MKRGLLFLFVVFSCLLPSSSEARTIKVLILDDVFQKVPDKDEAIEKMGKVRGDLLVNGSHYVGNIEVWKSARGLYLINELPLEEYVKNVVSSEVGANWEMEALKVQAVISRTYALYQKNLSSNMNFDITSSVMHQVYKGASVDTRIAYAVMTTEGEVLTYGGRLIEALYHSTSGGMTEDPQDVFGKGYPYLKPVETTCETSPYSVWERRIPVGEVEKALKLSGVKELNITARTSTGRVKTVDVVHGRGVSGIKATELRKMLGWSRIPSTNFAVSLDGDTAVFEGKGYGHGVGLCQWSALEMARGGMNYKDILSYFYPGTTIQMYENR